MLYNSQKLFYFFGIVLLFAIFCSCQEQLREQKRITKIFPGFKYSKAIAYDYDGAERGDLIIEKGKIHPTVKKEKVLTKEQTEDLLSILNDSLNYGGDVARCFKPHLGVVFYDENEKPKAQISICFLCNQHNSFPLITAQEDVRKSHPNKLHGYSEKGRAKLIKFCKELGFSNCSFTEDDLPSSK
jgi:hypothetical protein